VSEVSVLNSDSLAHILKGKERERVKKNIIMYALCAKTALSMWRKRIDPTCMVLEASNLRDLLRDLFANRRESTHTVLCRR